jgi:DNA polymerase-3 subunit epsilon
MLNKNFTIVDVETTGGSPAFSRVIEIGILKIEHGEVVEKVRTLINPYVPIPDFIAEYTGITDSMVKKAPKFEEVAEDILPLFEDSIFVAHNSSFDYGFLREEFRRAGLMFKADSLCTVRLSRILYPEFRRHNLSALIERFGFKCKARHRAFDDAKVLWDFFKKIQKDFPPEYLQKVFEQTVKNIPPSRQRKMLSGEVKAPELAYFKEAYDEYEF